MFSKLRKSNKGFTIIEVMIVLAIAGLIILIVLLAVPALQRNSRNTALKSDVGAVAGGVSTFVSNNDGAIPTNISGAVNSGKATVTDGTNNEDIKIQGGTSVTDHLAAAVPVAPAIAAVPPELIYAVRKQTCNLTPSSRGVALYYSIETSGGPSLKCTDA